MASRKSKRRSPTLRPLTDAEKAIRTERLFKAREVMKAKREAAKAAAASAASATPAPEISIPTPSSTSDRLSEAARAISASSHDAVQSAIDNWAEKGDTATSQMDSSNVRRSLDAADNAESTSDPDGFRARYEQASTTGLGYLKRLHADGNRTILVPPGCQVHPKLQAWGLLHSGLWMMIRWAYTGPKNNLQKKIQRGYQFFEGRVWCERLGLLPEVYLTKADNRINYLDLVLMWHTDAYISRHIEEATAANREMRAAVNEKLVATARGETGGGPGIKGITILEGRDEDVLRELKGRKDSAIGNRIQVSVP